MISLYRTVSYRFLRLRWSRAALIIVSIMLGVALLVATRVLIQSMQEGTTVTLNPFAHSADLIVMNGETGVPGELADELEEARIAGLERIEPLVIGDAGYAPEGADGVRVRIIGFDIDLQDRLRGIQDPKQTALEIQLDHDSKVTVQPGIVRKGDRSSKTWNEVVNWSALRTMWTEKRTPVVLGKKLAAQFGKRQAEVGEIVIGDGHGKIEPGHAQRITLIGQREAALRIGQKLHAAAQ